MRAMELGLAVMRKARGGPGGSKGDALQTFFISNGRLGRDRYLRPCRYDRIRRRQSAATARINERSARKNRFQRPASASNNTVPYWIADRVSRMEGCVHGRAGNYTDPHSWLIWIECEPSSARKSTLRRRDFRLRARHPRARENRTQGGYRLPPAARR